MDDAEKIMLALIALVGAGGIILIPETRPLPAIILWFFFVLALAGTAIILKRRWWQP